MKRIPVLILCLSAFRFSPAQSQPDQKVLMQYFEDQEFAKAADYLHRIIGEDSDNIHDLSLLGYTYYMSNQLAGAEQCYLRIWERDSSNVTACNYLGNINLKKNNFTLALHYFCRLIELKPGIAAYYKETAYTWSRMFNSSAASYYYRLAYFADPNDPGVVAFLADYWLQEKMYVRSDSILDAALLKDSLDAGLIEEKMKSAYLQEKYMLIFPLMARLKRMQVVDLNSFLLGAYGYYYLKQYQDCVETCDFLIMHDEQTLPVLFIEAMAFKQQQKYSLSLATLDECIGKALNSKANDYFSEKADIYQMLRQYNRAKSQYDTAYYIFQSPIMIYNKAVLYDVKLKEPRVALRYYREYLDKINEMLPAGRGAVFDYVRTRVKQIEDEEKKRQAR